MQIRTHVHGLFEHYFVKRSPIHSNYSLFDKALWPLAIGFVLAFLSLGVGGVTVFNTSLPALFAVLAIGGFCVFVVVHFVFVVIGSFYKRGIFKTFGWALFGVGVLLAGAIAVGVSLFGGIVISAVIFLFLLPIDTVFMPLNLIGFVVGSVWWYAKGIEIVDGYETPRSAVQTEVRFLKRLFSIEEA